MTSSPTSAPSTSSRARTTWSSSDRPGPAKTHLAIGLAIRACQAGHRTLFATASEWVARLADAHHAGRLQSELVRLGRYPLLVIDLCRYRDYVEVACEVGRRLASGLRFAGFERA